MNLDARQRAMLHAMGVRVWQPDTPNVCLQVAPEYIADNASKTRAKAQSGPKTAVFQDVVAAPRPAASKAPFVRQDAPPASGPAGATPDELATTGAPECWLLGQAQALFADTAQAGGVRWLVLAQVPPAALDAPAFDGDAGRLLSNMLRAARLHHNAGAVVFAPLVRQAISGPMDGFSSALSALIGQARPDIVLVMGRLAGQALLATNDEPFGKLRGRPHALQGRTAVVTYDAPYLLRCPQDKARAWEDLCMATGLATDVATKLAQGRA